MGFSKKQKKTTQNKFPPDVKWCVLLHSKSIQLNVLVDGNGGSQTLAALTLGLTSSSAASQTASCWLCSTERLAGGATDWPSAPPGDDSHSISFDFF